MGDEFAEGPAREVSVATSDKPEPKPGLPDGVNPLVPWVVVEEDGTITTVIQAQQPKGSKRESKAILTPKEYERRRKNALEILRLVGLLNIYKRTPRGISEEMPFEEFLDTDTFLEGMEIVCDLDKFRKGPYNYDMLRSAWGVTGSKDPDKRNLIPLLLRTFDGLKVYDKQDYNTASPNNQEPLELFCIPKNRQEAMSSSAARRLKYQLGLWELNTRYFPSKYPIRSTGGEPDFITTAVCQIIYNGKYGRGYRNSRKEPLLVRYPGEQTNKPISSEFFTKGMKFWGKRSEGLSADFNRPIDAFYLRCPDLTADIGRGSIYPLEDFKLITGSETDRIYNVPRWVTDNSMVTIQGTRARYYLGKERYSAPRGNFKVMRLSDKQAGIIGVTYPKDETGAFKEKSTLIGVFDVDPIDPAKVIQGRTGNSSYRIVSRDNLVIVEGREAILSKYGDLKDIIENFDEFLNFSLRCSVFGRFKLANLPLQKQVEAFNIFRQSSNKTEFWKYLEAYKEDGLRGLLVLEDMADDFIVNKRPESLFKERMLEQISGIQRILESAGQIQGEGVNREAIAFLNTAIIDQTRKIFAAGLPLTRGETLSYGYIDLISLLKTLKNRVEWHYSHIGSGGSDIYRQTVELLDHPDVNVRSAVMAFVQRDWSYGISLIEAKTRDLYATGVLSSAQEKAYDASLDLREWETQTADTYQSLRQIIQILRSQDKPTENILDIGTGQGRIGAKLARIGYKVYGVDISEEQLRMGRERIIEEGPGEALLRLQDEGFLDTVPLLDDEATAQNYIQVQGNFFNITDALRTHRINEKNDAAIITWHTYAEFGPPEKQKEVLSQIYEALTPGAKLIVEMPDRNSIKYARALKAYSLKNPDVRYGTVRDSNESGEYPPRYLSDKDELVTTLRTAGFEIDPKNDIFAYTVGEGEDAFTEYVYVARKPIG